ncbi:ATP-binding protein [Flagellimonas profundi]|uniref:ATP-binding protein n=1 Tax=Flagellimonas profundi TaxID=2915620 RepID=A0ABS3FAH4_9FLAO|nr:ATP-binding protein [Allomuricauda profundi]MBO0340161.1 ATP-binding protein [Allomuricauda profundi]
MDNQINGNPTKTFFIEMITRDISIKDAILDLLDNSIDGANAINPNDYTGLYIDITVSNDGFKVKDNCGGFTLETAKKYAFRFGRPDEMVHNAGSIGRFGVGMKRALFKMGMNFEVESKTDNDHFQIDVDVSQWKNKKKTVTLDNDDEEQIEIDDWNFEYQLISLETVNLEENGTYIAVSNLKKEVSAIFSDPEFLVELENDIERFLNFSLEKGLIIRLNGKELKKRGVVLFNEQSKPYMYEGIIDGVTVRISAGLSHVGEPKASGWYIYCNDRLVVEENKYEETGWGTSNIPKWHPDYVMFKGVVFLDSEDTIKLPLTTTKKGIDTTSELYKKVLFFMREAMSSVLGFLKEVRKLGSEANDYRKMLGEQEANITVAVLKTANIDEERLFISPEIDLDTIADKKSHVRIAYNVDRELASKAKQHSECSSFKQLGEYTFEYYLKMEELTN